MSKLVLIEATHPLDEESHYISLGYLASYLSKYYGDIEIVVKRSTGDLDIALKDGDMVGITAFTQNYNSALRVAKSAKTINSSVPVIIGGNHITFLPESMSEDMDIAVLGEGEETFLDIVRRFMGKKFDKGQVGEIQGVAYKNGDKLVKTVPRAPIRDLDSIPPPARSLTHTHKQYKRIEMLTSRGCPFKCVYCGSSAMWGQRVRLHSVDYVKAEIEEIIGRYHPHWLNFVDDLFILKRDRVTQIMEYIRNKGYHKNMIFYFTAHATMVDDELCKIFEGIQCRVSMGLESGSDRILKKIKTGPVAVEKNRKALETFAKYRNISVGCAFMVGLPDETVEDMQMTYDFIVNNPLNSGAVSVVTPFPGTYLWDYALKKNLVGPKMDWDKMRFNAKGSLRDKIIIDDAVTVGELERMLHKINEALYRIYIKNTKLRDMFSHARLTIPVLLRNLVNDPSKYLAFAKQYFAVKTQKLLKRG